LERAASGWNENGPVHPSASTTDLTHLSLAMGRGVPATDASTTNSKHAVFWGLRRRRHGVRPTKNSIPRSLAKPPTCRRRGYFVLRLERSPGRQSRCRHLRFRPGDDPVPPIWWRRAWPVFVRLPPAGVRRSATDLLGARLPAGWRFPAQHPGGRPIRCGNTLPETMPHADPRTSACSCGVIDALRGGCRGGHWGGASNYHHADLFLRHLRHSCKKGKRAIAADQSTAVDKTYGRKSKRLVELNFPRAIRT